MKLFYRLSSAVLAVGLASSAMAADTVIYISGATAFRNATNQAILKYLGAGVNNGTGVTPDCLATPNAVGAFSTTRLGAPGTGNATIGRFGYTGSNWASAKAMTVIANDFPVIGDRTIIKTCWTGSEAGIKAVADPATTTVKYLPTSFDDIADTTLTAAGASGLADPTVSPNANDSHLGADVAMADTWQETSNFYGGSYPTLTEANGAPVGIAPFIWIKQKGAPANITNMSANGARSLLLQTGYTDAQMISGNAADAGIRLYAIGRDLDSGTRFVTFKETAVGTVGVAVKQWRPNVLQGGSALSDYPASVGAATYSTTIGSPTITCSVNTNTINLCLGMTVSGAGIPANSIVGSFPAANTFKIISQATSADANATANGSGISLTIAKSVPHGQGTTNSLTTAKAWYKVPIQVVNGVSSVSIGNGGESSGGTIATMLKYTSTNAQGYAIAYVSTGDAVSAIQGAPGAVGVALTYEGVGLVTATNPTVVYDFTPIRTGSYKHWSYEHMFYNAATIAPAKKTVADAVAAQITNVDAALSNQCANDSLMKVKRAGTHVDGSNIIMNSYALP